MSLIGAQLYKGVVSGGGGGGGLPAGSWTDQSNVTIWDVVNGGQTSTDFTSVVFGSDILAVQPYVAPRAGTLDRYAFSVVTGGGADSARVGIYESLSATDPYPGALLLESGAIDVNATGTKIETISQTLTAGRTYWFAHVASAGLATYRALAKGDVSGIGTSGAFSATSKHTHITHAHTFGALPDPFPTSAPAGDNFNMLMFNVRYSA